jgi:hypothetical protein
MKPKLIHLSLVFVIALSFLFTITNSTVIAAREDRMCLPPPTGLNSWWPGDGSTVDTVGGLDAILHDNATFGNGLVNQAFSLDGNGDFVSVPHNAGLSIGTGDFTIDLWVIFKDTNGEQVLIEKWIQRGSDTSNPSKGWTLTKLESNILRLAMSSGIGADTNVDSDVLAIPSRTWIHFAATRRNGEVTLFMNGRPIAAGSSPLDLDSDSSLKFGHRGNPSDTPGSEDESGFYLNGRIDEVELYIGRALPDSQIQAIFRAGSAGKCKE